MKVKDFVFKIVLCTWVAGTFLLTFLSIVVIDDIPVVLICLLPVGLVIALLAKVLVGLLEDNLS